MKCCVIIEHFLIVSFLITLAEGESYEYESSKVFSNVKDLQEFGKSRFGNLTMILNGDINIVNKIDGHPVSHTDTAAESNEEKSVDKQEPKRGTPCDGKAVSQQGRKHTTVSGMLLAKTKSVEHQTQPKRTNMNPCAVWQSLLGRSGSSRSALNHPSSRATQTLRLSSLVTSHPSTERSQKQKQKDKPLFILDDTEIPVFGSAVNSKKSKPFNELRHKTPLETFNVDSAFEQRLQNNQASPPLIPLNRDFTQDASQIVKLIGNRLNNIFDKYNANGERKDLPIEDNSLTNNNISDHLIENDEEQQAALEEPTMKTNLTKNNDSWDTSNLMNMSDHLLVNQPVILDEPTMKNDLFPNKNNFTSNKFENELKPWPR